MVCLIGPSGSGKSTLLRCINGLERYDGGRITIDGVTVDARRKDIQNIRQRVAMVFQRFNLFPHRTALENVIEGPVHVKGESIESATARGREILASVGLAEKMSHYPQQLSGGSSSAWPLPARWRWSPRPSCSTSRPRRWILSLWAKCCP